MVELQTLIFDLDGTLAETERDGHRVAFNRAFAESGLDWYWDVALYGKLLKVSGGKERIRYYLNHHQSSFHFPTKRDETFIMRLHQLKTHYYTQLIENQGLILRPGVTRLIHLAREKELKLAIATTTAMENVTALLQTSIGPSALDWFDCIAAGDVVRFKKPAPDIYYYCLDQLRVEPAQCLAFEDSENGVRAAVGAGIKTVVTVSDYTRDEDFTGAVLVLDHLGEPDQPCTVIRGKRDHFTYVDIELLQRL